MRYLDPPDEYDWPWCEDYSLLMGMETITMRAGEDCPTCPMKHRCPDGISVIRSRRDEEMIARCESCEAWGQSCATCSDSTANTAPRGRST